MQGFIGRREELDALERIYSDGRKKVCVVYGRRRVGKSFLLKEFCETRRSLFINCNRWSEADNLRIIADVVSELNGTERLVRDNLYDALKDVAACCSGSKTVVVFDEFPYLVDAVGDAPYTMQNFLDNMLMGTETMVILCGSSKSALKRETEDRDRPLYGRMQYRLEVGPMPYGDTILFHPDLDELDNVRLYLTLGGIPLYHDIPCDSYRGFVVSNFLTGTGPLRGELVSLMNAEFSPVGRYIDILGAIADGSVNQKGIAERTRMSNVTCMRSLEEMETVGLVERLRPMLGAPKRPVYRISDNLTEFHERVVRYAESMPTRDPERQYDALEDRINTFLGFRFEYMCAEFLSDNYDCLEIGKWWGEDRDRNTHDIDVVARVQDGRNTITILAECKFRRRRFGMAMLDDFDRSVGAVRGGVDGRRMLFSASGFSDEVEEIAESRGILLVDLPTLLGHRPAPEL